MKRGIDIIRALIDGDETEQIERYWALSALAGYEPDNPYTRREAWLQWRLRDHPEWLAERERFKRMSGSTGIAPGLVVTSNRGIDWLWPQLVEPQKLT
jgi:hypothetical protein